MARKFLLVLLKTFARALMAHGCGEIIRMIIQCFAPGTPAPACMMLGLMVGVALVEITAKCRRRAVNGNE